VAALVSTLLGLAVGACASGSPDASKQPQQPALVLQAGHCCSSDGIDVDAPSRHCTAQPGQVTGAPVVPQAGMATCAHWFSVLGAGSAPVRRSFGSFRAVTRSLAQLQVWRH
jgi:hypothetical protein